VLLDFMRYFETATIDSPAIPAEEMKHVERGRDLGTRAQPPVAFVLYHYFPPDEVVSAVHFGEVCSGLVRRGWSVSAFPCIWACRDDATRFPKSDQWLGVNVRRIWRPKFRQASALGRILNAVWMIFRWSLLALQRDSEPDILLIGTDPVLSVLVASFWRRFRPRTKIVHWCFDLYPEAAFAEGLLSRNGMLARSIKWALRSAYRSCSVIADLGPCMRDLLSEYPSNAHRETLVPWAIDEPESPLGTDSGERRHIFGDAKLALLYSGSFGFAHSYDEILSLAEILQSQNIRVAFSVGGNRKSELEKAARSRGLDIAFVPFAKASEMRSRIACADVHLVTLRDEWTGMVVPSKFFGALSAGRPVLFAGNPRSSLATWVKKYRVGWNLHSENLHEISGQLLDYSRSAADQDQMRERCFAIYHCHFSKETQITRWDEILRSLLT
jgi:putative colanic acid biosynthesis glycosyltransferase WcaI